jgi:hypothetical protein
MIVHGAAADMPRAEARDRRARPVRGRAAIGAG